MMRLIDIRCYRLRPGTGVTFHELVKEQSLPLLIESGTDVIGYGQSVDEDDAYFLIRAYDSVDERQSSQDAFYSSDAWRDGPREAIMELIESNTNATFWLSEEAVQAMRKDLRQ